MAGELAGRLEVIDAELADVRKRLERLYEALETKRADAGGPVPPHLLATAPRGAADGRAGGCRNSA